MTEAIARLHLLFQSSQLLVLKEHFEQDLVDLLRDMTISVLRQQNQTGSWGSRNSKEETAYAVLILTYAVHFEFSEIPRHLIRRQIHDGCSFLCSNAVLGSERLWVEKVTYESEMLSQAYTLAALKKAADLLLQEQHKPEGVFTNSANGHHAEPIETNGHHAEPIEDHAELNGHPAEPIETNGHIAEFTEIGSKGTNGASCTETNGTETKTTDVLPTPTVELHGPHENGHFHTEITKLVSVDFNGASNHSYQREWTDDQEQILLGPFDYLESLPGKNIRSQFIQAFNSWLQVPTEHLEVVEKAISMLHTASLLVDDIEDSSLLRRGQPVAHSIFGTAQTFNSGNYVYFLALREIQKLRSSRATEIYVDALIHLHRGQGMDVFWRDSLICPTEEDYLDMVSNKTGALFCLAIELLQIGSPVQVDLVPLVRLFGIIFQICDDYLNLKSPSYLQKKGLCDDLTEGKFSFPIVHSIRSNPTNRRLINVLKQKPRDDDIKRYAVAYMETTNTFEYTRDFVGSLKAEALEMIEDLEKQGLGDNLAIRKLLARLSVDG